MRPRRPSDDAETIATTVGRPRPGFELRLVDERAATRCPTGEAGEVLLRGGSVMAGYLDDPEETAKALSPDGWLRTGDLGVLDEAGRLRIVGPGQGHVHRRRLQRLSGGDRERPAAPPRRSGRPR